MATQEEITEQQLLLDNYRRRLSYNIKQQLAFGTATPFNIVEDIRQAREEIRRIKGVLHDWNALVDDLHDDDPPAPALLNGVLAVPLPPSPPQQISRGLDALSVLMQEPQVRAAVVTFRTDFQAACEQIDSLSDYKDLHDLLHTLQFQCFNPIVREARRFPDDETAQANLTDYELTLQDLVDQMRGITGRKTFSVNETLWLQALVQARAALCAAVEGSDAQRLKRGIWLINRVLAVQPAQINTRLNAAARALRLPALVQALTYVRDSLARPELDAEKVRQFEAGVEALTSLNQSLNALVHEHDQWQAVDLELRRIEANLGSDTTELELSWPELKVMAAPLYSSAEEWARTLRADCEKLDSATAAQDIARIRQGFQRYRRQTGDRFYRVDANLKRLCDDLREIGDPLASVLQMIV
jgi:hypothetical protein